MDASDDDFGELYADVEVQVKSVINNAPELTKFYTEPVAEQEDEEDKSNQNNKSHRTTSLERDDESDSEDELRIVLNDDDYDKLPVPEGGSSGGGGFNEDEDGLNQVVCDGLQLNSNDNNNNGHSYISQRHLQYKYIRSHGSALPSNLRVNGSMGMTSFSSMPARGDWKDNGSNQHKGSKSGQVARIHAGSVVPQCTYGFLLPWYRTILDFNIDAFEEKPWNQPEANISDFFNFGFNEESWRSYCSVLQSQFQDYTVKQAGNAVYDSSKLDQPKGRAIEVEGSIGERQPSMDVKRPRIQDSDVVIQINIQDCAEDFSWSGKEQLGHTDSNSSEHEPSKNGDLDVDCKRGVPYCGSASGDEVSADSLEKAVRNTDLPSASERFSEHRSASNQTSLGSDNHGNGQISDGDGQRHQNLSVRTSDRTSKAVGTLKRAEEVDGRKACESDLCLETDVSLADRSHISLSPSSSGNDSDVSKNSFHGDPVRVYGLSKRQSLNSGTEIIGDYKESICNSTDMKPGDKKKYLKRRSSYQEDRRLHNRRCQGVTKQKIYPKNNDDTFPLSDGQDDEKGDLTHGSVKEKWKNCLGSHHSASEHTVHPGIVSDPGRESLHRHSRDYKSVCRQKQRSIDHDYHSTEDFSHNRGAGFSSGYGSERFGDKQIKYVDHVHQKYPRGKYYRRSRDWIDPYRGSKWDERENSHERNTRVDNEDDIDRDQYYHTRGDGRSWMFVPKYSSAIKERGTKWRSKSDKPYGKGINQDYCLLDVEGDDFVHEEYRRSVSFTKREVDYMDTVEERDLPFIGREAKFPIQRGRSEDSYCLDWDRSWSMENEHEYERYMEQQSSISRRSGEWFTDYGRRLHDNITSIDDAYNSKFTGRYRRHRRYICDEELGDIYNVTDDTEDRFLDDKELVHPQRRRHSWKSEELCGMEDDLIARDWDNELFAEKLPFYYEETSRSERICPKYESDHDGMLFDDTQVERHRYNITREGSSAKCVDKNYKISYRGEHEHTVLRCRDSVDWFVGEEKSCERWSNGRSLMCSSKVKKIDLKLAKEQTNVREFHESDKGKAVRIGNPEIESNTSNTKWLDNFRVTKHNEDLDIEEGQIVTEEPGMERDSEKKHVFDSTTPTRNVKKRISGSNAASSENMAIGDYDSQRLLETVAKMEKRRERFKDLTPLKKEPDKNIKPEADLLVDAAETKQQRPVRKRRWNQT